MLIKDLANLSNFSAQGWKASKLLSAIMQTAGRLGMHTLADELKEWAVCLGHYGQALQAGYEMRPTVQQRSTFKMHAQSYVMRKALLRPGRLCWYDWQLWSAFPLLFHRSGSLRLLSQEGMEGQQKLNNEIANRSNGWCNAGAVPKGIMMLGEIVVKAYKAVRLRLVTPAAQWMWQQMQLCWLGHTDDTVGLARSVGANPERCLDWQDEFTPTWHAYLLFAPVYCRYLAKARLHLARDRAPAAECMDDDPDEEEAGASTGREPFEAAYTERLRRELRAWATVDVARGDLSDATYRAARRTAQRKWWRKNNTLYEHDFLEEEEKRQLHTGEAVCAAEDSDMEDQ